MSMHLQPKISGPVKKVHMQCCTDGHMKWPCWGTSRQVPMWGYDSHWLWGAVTGGPKPHRWAVF